MYYLGIQTELNKYQIQEQKKIMLTEKLVKLQSQIDQIVNPKKIISIQQIMEEARNYNYNNDKEKGTKTNISESKKENKPIIDYGAKIRVLEKELEYTYQGFNLIKAKNNKLISQLDELRKQNLYHLSKLNEMKKVVAKSDEKFTKDKTQVEENLSKKDEEKIYKQLLEKQKILNEVNLKMTENIKDINLEISKKKAKEKYLNFEKKKLEKKAEIIEKKRISQLNKFNNEIQQELDKIKDFKKKEKMKQEFETKSKSKHSIMNKINNNSGFTQEKINMLFLNSIKKEKEEKKFVGKKRKFKYILSSEKKINKIKNINIKQISLHGHLLLNINLIQDNNEYNIKNISFPKKLLKFLNKKFPYFQT